MTISMTRAAAAATARRQTPPAESVRASTPQRPTGYRTRSVEQFDSEHGGFGIGGKFLHLGPLRFALAHYAATRAGRTWRHRAPLADVAAGEPDDRRRGRRRVPRTSRSRLVASAHREDARGSSRGWPACCSTRLASSTCRDWVGRARDIMRFVERTLCDRTRGGFYASQRADDDSTASAASDPAHHGGAGRGHDALHRSECAGPQSHGCEPAPCSTTSSPGGSG